MPQDARLFAIQAAVEQCLRSAVVPLHDRGSVEREADVREGALRLSKLKPTDQELEVVLLRLFRRAVTLAISPPRRVGV